MRIFILLLVWLGLAVSGHTATDAENRINFVEALDKAAACFRLLEKLQYTPSADEKFLIGEMLIIASHQADKVDAAFLEKTNPGMSKAFQSFATGCGVYGFGVHGDKLSLKRDGERMLLAWVKYWNPIKEEMTAKLNPEGIAK